MKKMILMISITLFISKECTAGDPYISQDPKIYHYTIAGSPKQYKANDDLFGGFLARLSQAIKQKEAAITNPSLHGSSPLPYISNEPTPPIPTEQVSSLPLHFVSDPHGGPPFAMTPGTPTVTSIIPGNAIFFVTAKQPE